MIASAILVTFNSAAVIGQALASLPSGMQVIVVDNASTDDSAGIAESAGATVTRLATNTGFGVANNTGLQAATTEWVLLLNPDATLSAGCMDAFAAVIEQGIDADVLVPTVRTKGGVSRKWRSPIADPAFRMVSTPAGTTPIAFASGAALLVRRSLITRIGGFDPEIFLYFEDDDLSRRVLDAGGHIVHVAAAEVVHTGNVSTPPSAALTNMKHWHMAWSERHVRQKFGLRAPGYWRMIECFVKMSIAYIRGDRMERAKQRGLITGTMAHMRGVKAQDVRDSLLAERI